MIEELKRWEARMIAEHGFAIHYTAQRAEGPPAGSAPWPRGFADYHTHGFQETWSHPDLQLVITIGEGVAHGIFWAFARRVEAGERFEDGQDVEDVIGGGLRVRMRQRIQNGRLVLRVLLPDPEGKLPGDEGCEEFYAGQDRFDTGD